MKRFTPCVLAALFALPSLQAMAAADLVLTNGKVFTGVPGQALASARTTTFSQNQALLSENAPMRSNQLTSRPDTTGIAMAQRNGLLFAQAEHSISQPAVGSAHSTYTGIQPNIAPAIDHAGERKPFGECTQIGGNLVDGFFRNGVRSDVRRDQHARMSPQGMTFAERFFGKDIEQNETQMAALQMGEQRVLIDQRPAPGIDDGRILRQQRETLAVE